MNIGAGRALLLVLLVVPAAVVGGIALTDSTIAADGGLLEHLGVHQSEPDGERNGTPAHRNPDEYSGEGDLDSVQAQLASQLSERLGEGAVQLSDGEYEAAKEYLGDDYRDQLGQYGELTNRTDGESAEDEFENASETQAQLSETVRAYRETKSEYETAYEANEANRSRELARELEALATDADRLGASLRESYERIEAETGTNTSASIAAVENVTEEIRTEQETVREQQFEETSLTLNTTREDISFSEPLIASGELRTADGSPIANRTIRMNVGNRTENVTTDSAGAFTLEYRPTTEPLSTDQLEIAYVPRTQAPYLGDETAVNVSIEQSRPTVSLDAVSSDVSYEDEAAVAGELTVDGVPVDNVTLEVVLADYRIGTVNVTEGEFDGTAPIPADAPGGTTSLGVELPFADRALAATADRANVTVSETESRLSIDEIAADQRTVTIAGTFGTPDGDGIAGEPVRIRIGDSTVGTATTREDGTFGATVTVPDSVGTGDLTVTAVYDGDRSNLESATDDAVVAVRGSGAGLSQSVLLAGGLLVLLAAAVGVWWYRRYRGDEFAGRGYSGSGRTADGTTSGRSPETSVDAVEPLLERANDQLSSGRPDEAVRTGYAAVRRALTSQLDERDALTHWEFYRTYRDAVDDDSLYDITREYERAVFGHGDLSPNEASTVLERARRLCSRERASDGGRPVDE